MPVEPLTRTSRAEALLNRFLSYVQIDTQSDPSSSSYPSTDKQLTLLRQLASELRQIGCADVSFDEHGYVTATIPSTLPADAKVPVVGFLAHVDTTPEITGAGVRPLVWP